jgi:hypothetical protein
LITIYAFQNLKGPVSVISSDPPYAKTRFTVILFELDISLFMILETDYWFLYKVTAHFYCRKTLRNYPQLADLNLEKQQYPSHY